MNILDENISEHQRQLLRSWRVPAAMIGVDLSRKGIQDEQIIPLLHSLNKSTFFTRDKGFYRRDLCHSNYCLVCLEVHRAEVALFVRRFLRHPGFRARAQRMGKVVRMSSAGIQFWRLSDPRESALSWKTTA